MACEYCLANFAANSCKELQNRIRNMEAYPQVRVSPCPVCGGTDWATTEVMIPREQLDGLPSIYTVVLYVAAVAGLLTAGVCFYLMR